MEVTNFTPLLLKPRQSTSVPNEYDDEWTPQPVWTLLKKKFCHTCRDSNPGPFSPHTCHI